MRQNLILLYNYNEVKELKRHNRTNISYKITKEYLVYAIKMLSNNEQITMIELKKLILLKYPEFNITPQHLGIVLRDNNITRKRTKHQHFPKTRFRYTQNQRRLETRTKKYNKIIEEVNNTNFINGKNIKEIESVLSSHNKKTCNYEKFKNYLIEKNKLNLLLFSHYEKTFFRKFKLNRYINTQKSESKMIKNFTKKFGEPNDVVFIMGDYDKGSSNIGGLEPTICKKFRKIFKNAGFRTYLVNEFRTSKLCNCCHREISPFMIRQSHKPNDIKVNKKITINGLLSHQEDKQKCEIIHNRDKNAVQNMLNIVESIFTIGRRPDIFTRIHT